MIKAALDLGSNTFLLLVVEVNGQSVKVLRDETRFVRLAEGLNQSRRLSRLALDRADRCLQEYRAVLDEFGLLACETVATSAARDAENASEFEALLKKFGFEARIITGDEEARLTFKGSAFDLAVDMANHGVIDIGGGSTEVAFSLPSLELWKKSFNIGGVRLTESHLSYGPLSQSELKSARSFVRQTLEKGLFNLGSDHVSWVAVAGTPVVLAQLELGAEFNEARIHGFDLSMDKINYWVNCLAPLAVPEREGLPGMPRHRADIVVAGALILSEFLSLVGKESVVVSTKGLRYGLIH